jgi:dTDP-4-dehydrorhamnose reductase
MSGKLLVVGASGVLGSILIDRAVRLGYDVTGTYFSHRSFSHRSLGHRADVAELQLDVRDPVAVRGALEQVRPDVVIHTAKGRDGDAWSVTADGAGRVACATAAAGVRLIHVSSDAIFSGRDVTYTETALPDPGTTYGAAKAAAETVVKIVAPDAVIVRTSLVLGGPDDPNERLVHDLAAGRRQGALFTDDIRTPVHVDDLSDALLELAATRFAGIINVAGADAISRYDLGVLIALRDGLDPALLPTARCADLDPTRPRDVRLDLTLARGILSTRLRGAREFIGSLGPARKP